MSWMNKKRARRGIASKLLETFLARAIHFKLKIVIIYFRTYRNVSEDDSTRNTVKQIEHWVDEMNSEWVGIPGLWSISRPSDTKEDMAAGLPVFGLCHKMDVILNVAEWNHSSYTVSRTSANFVISALQSGARHQIADRLAIGECIPVWNPSADAALLCGAGETEHDLRDFGLPRSRIFLVIGHSRCLPIWALSKVIPRHGRPLGKWTSHPLAM